MAKEHMCMNYDDPGELAQELNKATDEGWQVIGFARTGESESYFPMWSALLQREKKEN